ncbi:MAG: ice-binding family protein [Gemmatimonadota bacterium]|nr:ice-binding family protein [Gemmatimonadota bacterium]
MTGGVVNGSIGIHPGTALTGFGPCVNTGTKDLGNTAAAVAKADLNTAFIAASAPATPCGNLIIGDLGGQKLAAGVYCSGSSIGLTGVLTLDGGGDPNATFVFQAGSTLTTAGSVVLINGAQAKNVCFVVGSSAIIGVGSQIQGNILAQASITLKDNATLVGRALARDAAVTLGTGNVITLPP